MMRNEMFELIRASQLEDGVIVEGIYWKCPDCDRVEDIYIKAWDSEDDNSIFICKDCFCKSNSWNYWIPFHYLGESGYIKDDINKFYLYDKHKTFNQGGLCYGCGNRTNYGVFSYITAWKEYYNPLTHVFLCKECFTSQDYVNEELHVLSNFKNKGLKVFNESKQRK